MFELARSHWGRGVLVSMRALQGSRAHLVSVGSTYIVCVLLCIYEVLVQDPFGYMCMYGVHTEVSLYNGI